jgi:dihydrolipoamide dehydrogenase
MKNAHHLAEMGITVPEVHYDREGIASHAKNLANRVKGNLEASLVGLGVQVVTGRGVLTGKPHEIMDDATGKVYTAKVGKIVPFSILAFLVVVAFCPPLTAVFKFDAHQSYYVSLRCDGHCV